MHCVGRKWAWPFRSWDYAEICCISRMNWWNELIFSCWYKFRKPKSFGKNLVPEIWAKMLLAIQITGFFACWYRFLENRSWLKIIGVGLVKNRCGHSVLRTLKLAVCQGKMNEINWFWCVDTNSWKLKVTLTIFGWWWSKMGMAFKVLEL